MTATEMDQATTGERDEQPELRPDDLFHILQNERRRRVLRLLLDGDGETFDVGEISERIAAMENDCPRDHVTSNQRKRVYIALYQCHLPQMDDVAVVEYEQSRGRVSPGPTLHQVARYLEMMDEPGTEVTASTGDGGSTATGSGVPVLESLTGTDGAAVGNLAVAAVAVVGLVGAWVDVVAAPIALAAVTLVAVLSVLLVGSGPLGTSE